MGEARKPSEGFGSRLVQDAMLRKLGGTVDYDWRADGLAVRFCCTD